MTEEPTLNAAPELQFAVEWWPTERPRDYEGNPRDYSEKEVSEMARSLQEFGWVQPIVVDADGVIIIGHRRRRAARQLGAKSVPVYVATDLPAEKIRALRIADNKLGETEAWDAAKLATELQAIAASAFTGFSTSEVESILQSKLGGTANAPEYPMSPKLHERYDYVILACDNETDWIWLKELLELRVEKSYKSNDIVGIGHVVTVERLSAIVERLRGTKP